MALLKKVGLLCHHQQRNLLGWDSTGVTVQAVGKVLSFRNCESPLQSSGPVRYVRKAESQKKTDGRQSTSLKTRDAEDEGSTRPISSAEETDKNAKIWTRGEDCKPSRGSIRKRSPDPSFTEAYAEPSSSKSTENSNSHVKLDRGQRTPLPDINTGEVSDDHGTFNSSVGMASEGESSRRATSEDVRLSARKYTVGLLSRRPQTELHLREKMAKKNFPSQVIEEEISALQRCGLQSDKEYAEIFARSRWTDNTWGPTRIKYELLRRGVGEETIRCTLQSLFQRSDNNLGGEQQAGEDEEEPVGRWGMTRESARHLVVQARRRWIQGNLEIGARRRRLIGWLQRRGFPWSTVQDVLKAVESSQHNLS